VSDEQQPQLLRAATYFPVADLARQRDYYERVLGCRCEYVGGDPPIFAVMTRDALTLMFKLVSSPEAIRPNEEQGGTWDAFCWVRDVGALYAEFQSRGAEVVYEPTVQAAYGMIEMAVRDPEGYVLGFGETLAKTGP